MSINWKSTRNDNKKGNSLFSHWSRQQKLAVMVCFALLGVLFIVSACSKQSAQPPAGVSSLGPNSPTTLSGNAPPVTTPQPASASALIRQAAAKKTAKKRSPNVTYADADSGVSFVYPRRFALSTGEKARPGLDDDVVPMNFAEDGGTTIATVALPKSIYPGTDLITAFFSVNVNRQLSEEECSHFAFVDTRNADDEPIDAEKVKVGSADMEMTSEFAGSATKQAEAQYYHRYENGSCYEYVLGLGTAGYGLTDGITPVDRDEVFARLEKIMTTVKIRPAAERQVAEQNNAQSPATAVEAAK